MKKNWLLEYHFVRGDFSFCKKIIQDLSPKSDNTCQDEYSNYVQARIYYAEGKIQESSQLFQLCYSKNPNNPGALQEIAKYLIAQGRYKKAVEALMLAKLLIKQPDFMLLHDLARCNLNLKEYALAEENCREAIKICKSKSIYKLLAACLIRQRKTGEAIEVFRLSLRLFPKSSQLYTTFGKLCVEMGFNEDAMKTLSAAIKLDDNNTVALNEIAVLHQKRDEIDDAINRYMELVCRGMESASIFSNLGLCYFYKDKFVMALTCLLRARDIDSTSSETLFNLGLVFASLHQYCSAFIHWKAAAVYATNKSFVDQELVTLLSACLPFVNKETDT
ncbi:Bardet-Biedl syndrome 4 protein-like [Daphnia carinata]|uniref:Bardet-Biedl syndrome 4 protein-like n=1 Tax=Daphnia carinata TaxID=120202 RepID=UPI00257B9163|nr:Bardet-Biedl syndrome 4 protein-like [Daphnia carinata]